MTPGVEREAPRPGGVFVGRERELAELDAGLDEAEGGRGSLFLLVGEPGIGKSRLADELAARARERGFLVLWGRCWEAGGAPAYWPWIQALRAHVRAAPADLADQLGAGAGHVAQMIPDVRAVLPDVDVPEVGNPDAARFQLFDAATSFLMAVSARQPILLALDDLHAADTASLLLLRFASGELARGRVLVVSSYRAATGRGQDVQGSHALFEATPVQRRVPADDLGLEGHAEHLTDIEGRHLGQVLPTFGSPVRVQPLNRR